MRITDEEIIAAMLTHSTNRKAAEAVRLSDRAFYNRIRKPSFQAKLAEEKARILESAANAARGHISDAVQVMAQVMADEENAPGVRIQAADGLIRNSLKLLEITDISQRLDALEARLEEQEEQ